MTRDTDPFTPEEERARAALEALPPVEPAPEFRERLLREFVSGEIGAVARGRRRWRRAVLAAAVLLAAGAALLRANRGGEWAIGATSDTGSVEVDGQTISVTERAALARLLLPGAHVITDGRAEVQLVSPGMLVLVITPNTSAVLPGIPGRWLGRAVTASLERGELRGVTGPRFSGAQLSVVAPEATAEITGTTFAVLHDAEGSCACVLEGNVSLSDASGTARVAPGHRRVVPPGGGPPRDEPIRPMEQMKLEMLRDQTAPRLATE